MTDSLERLDELLFGEATNRLNEAEQAELQALLREQPEMDRYAYERAASTFFIAVCADSNTQMPETLSTKLRLDATQILEKGGQ